MNAKPVLNAPKKTAMRVQDMTTGRPLPLILRFAVPLFIGNIFQQIYSMVDTMVAGHCLGESAIAAIGATSALYGLIINFASGMNSGYAIVVTRSFGAHDHRLMRQAIAGMAVLNAAVTAALTVLAVLFLRPLLRFMNTPAAIFADAYRYILVICCGMAATVAYNMFAAILRAVGNSRSPLYFLILSCVLNILLDVWFIAGLGLGVAGAALATVIAQAVSAVLCGVYLLRSYRGILPNRQDFRLPRRLWGELLSTGFAMALMLCVVDLGTVIFQRSNNALGEMYITAHTAARRLIMMIMQPLVTIATANSTFVGQNWGAGKTDRIRTALKQVCCAEVAWALCGGALLFLLGGPLVRFTTGTTDAEVVRNAVLSLRIHSVFFAPLGILFCLRTSMQAMGRKAAPVISSCIELGLKILSAGVLVPRLGFIATCFTEPLIWVAMVSYLLAVYLLRREELFAAPGTVE